jgi:hypothetical protein
MTKFLIFLFLFGIVMFFIGVMNPENAVAWGKRTRIQAVLTYSPVIAASVVGIALGSTDFLMYIDYLPIIGFGAIFGVWGGILFLASKELRRTIATVFFIVMAISVYISASGAIDKTEAMPKAPAQIVIDSTDVYPTTLEGGGYAWKIVIHFRETAGEVGAKGTPYGFLYDAKGGAWKSDYWAAKDLNLEPFNIEAGKSYAYEIGFRDYEKIFKNGHVELTFTFVDEAGRTSKIPWYCRLN